MRGILVSKAMLLLSKEVFNIQWIPTVARRTELVDSHSSLEDRIDGFPQ